MADIVVIGSLNMDLSVNVERLPSPGETIGGGALMVTPGGKGANQAVACAKLGAQVALVGSVGQDSFGKEMMAGLQGYGVDVSDVAQLADTPTGTAVILVDKAGENCIVISPGANGENQIQGNQHITDLIEGSKLVLLQLEIPLEVVSQVVDLAHNAGVPVLLNPAPAVSLPEDLLKKVTYLVPNETESTLLSGVEVNDLASAQQAAEALREKGVQTIIITLGAKGAFVSSPDFEGHIPSIEIQPVDTTAAGDAFIGAFAFAQTHQYEMQDAVRFACCAGALTATKNGAQISLPDFDDIQNVFSPKEV